MKIFTVIIRSLIGLFLLFASISYFAKVGGEHEPPTGNLKIFMDGVVASKYLLPLAKYIELVCGLALVSGRFVTLANIVLLPITINLFLIHAFMEPGDLLVVGLLLAANIFLIYTKWDSYKNIFEMR
jgi:uncharacterized membrane protein YphA (DoxX/SURF4 family)